MSPFIVLFLVGGVSWLIVSNVDGFRERDPSQATHWQTRRRTRGGVAHVHTWKKQLIWIDRRETMFEQVDVCSHAGCGATREPRPGADAR